MNEIFSINQEVIYQGKRFARELKDVNRGTIDCLLPGEDKAVCNFGGTGYIIPLKYLAKPKPVKSFEGNNFSDFRRKDGRVVKLDD